MRNDPQFTTKVLFTDEAKFTRDGMFNMHNAHIWSTENPHAIVPRKAQHQFSVNSWCGILGDNLVGPYLIPDCLNGPIYLRFLRNILPGLLSATQAGVQQQIWYMHDSVPLIFLWACVTTLMEFIRQDGLDVVVLLLGLHPRRTLILWISYSGDR